MKELLKLLGLKAKATETQLADAVKALCGHAAQVRSLLGLAETATHDEVHALLAKLVSAPKPAPTGGFDPAALAAKLAAGLTRDQAIAALAAQAEHDATAPHDAVPVGQSVEEAAPEESESSAAAEKSTQEAPAA